MVHGYVLPTLYDPSISLELLLVMPPHALTLLVVRTECQNFKLMCTLVMKELPRTSFLCSPFPTNFYYKCCGRLDS
jgi:hypothetical protein